jgi:hypothetical protein
MYKQVSVDAWRPPTKSLLQNLLLSDKITEADLISFKNIENTLRILKKEFIEHLCMFYL